jgi:hypothetical protein
MSRHVVIGTTLMAICIAGCGDTGSRQGPEGTIVASSSADLGGRAKIMMKPTDLRSHGPLISGVGSLASTSATIVWDRIPDGPMFSIIGEHYPGKNYFRLVVKVARSKKLGPKGGRTSILSTTNKTVSPLILQLMTGCSGSQEYAIAYGLLREKADHVIAYTSGKAVRLRHIKMPVDLHVGDELVYAILPGPLTDVVVQTGTARVVTDEKYGQVSSETCPGGHGATVGTIG